MTSPGIAKGNPWRYCRWVVIPYPSRRPRNTGPPRAAGRVKLAADSADGFPRQDGGLPPRSAERPRPLQTPPAWNPRSPKRAILCVPAAPAPRLAGGPLYERFVDDTSSAHCPAAAPGG